MLHKLGRAALAYSLKKLAEQKAQSHDRSKSSRRKSSRSKTRDRSSTSKRGSSRGDLPRGDSDMHAVISQLAVGIFAFGTRYLIKRRRDAKRKAAAAAAKAAATTRDMGPGGQGPGQRPAAAVDPELSAALDSVTRELQGASESIRRLAHSAPPAHRDCVVRDALVADADRLNGSLANMQASIHNMKNLHPGLEPPRRRRDRVLGRERTERGERMERPVRMERGDNRDRAEYAREMPRDAGQTEEGRTWSRREQQTGEGWVRSAAAQPVEETVRARRHRSHRGEEGPEEAAQSGRYQAHREGEPVEEVVQSRRHRRHRGEELGEEAVKSKRHRSHREEPREEAVENRKHRSHRGEEPAEDVERRKRYRSHRGEDVAEEVTPSGKHRKHRSHREHGQTGDQPPEQRRSRRSRREEEELQRGRQPERAEQ
jgi:hypothetical protein